MICDEVVNTICNGRYPVDTPQILQSIGTLKDEAERRDLLFGELLAVVLIDMQTSKIVKEYKKQLLQSFKKLKPLFNHSIENVCKETVEAQGYGIPVATKNQMLHLYQLACKSEYNSRSPIQVIRNSLSVISDSVNCNPVIYLIAEDKSLLELEEAKLSVKCIYTKAITKELKFGDILLLLLHDKRYEVSEVYFTQIWQVIREMRNFFDIYIWEISDEMIDEFLHGKSMNTIRFSMHWFKWARESEYNTHRSVGNYGIHDGPAISYRPNRNRRYVQDVHFRPSYKLPRNARLETVFKYWLFLNRDNYSDSYIVDVMVPAFKKLKQLHGKIFHNIRPYEINQCMSGYSQNSKNNIIILYRKLDRLAFEHDLTSQLYSDVLIPVKTIPQNGRSLGISAINSLKQHSEELESAITLVLLYTGMTAQEICLLRMTDIQDGLLCIDYLRTPYLGRNIPIHAAIAGYIGRVVEYFSSLQAEGAGPRRRRFGISRIVEKATIKYCGEKYTPENCRSTFAENLRQSGATNSVIEYLMGTEENFIRRYEGAYIHPSPERIRKAIENLP